MRAKRWPKQHGSCPTTSTQLVDITRLAHAREQFAGDRNWAQIMPPRISSWFDKEAEPNPLLRWFLTVHSEARLRQPHT